MIADQNYANAAIDKIARAHSAHLASHRRFTRDASGRAHASRSTSTSTTEDNDIEGLSQVQKLCVDADGTIPHQIDRTRRYSARTRETISPPQSAISGTSLHARLEEPGAMVDECPDLRGQQCTADVCQSDLRCVVTDLEVFEQAREPPGLDVLIDKRGPQQTNTDSFEHDIAIEHRAI
jgi:hypothetical protein